MAQPPKILQYTSDKESLRKWSISGFPSMLSKECPFALQTHMGHLTSAHGQTALGVLYLVECVSSGSVMEFCRVWYLSLTKNFTVFSLKFFKSLPFFLCSHRFMQLAPPYYFSNLPPSESKDILQQVINHLAPISTVKKDQKPGKEKMCEECPEAAAEPRCVIQ